MQSFGNWYVVRQLGEGGFGEVYLWKNRITDQEIATKSLKSNAKLRPDEVDILKRRCEQEFQWMQELQNPYIVGAVQLTDSAFLQYLKDSNNWTSVPVIVMEYCNGGDLRSHLSRVEHVNGLPENDIRGILLALRHAVEYLHQQCNIEHRDIKPENIVIHHSANERSYKLTDFGYAREIPYSTIAQSVVGTRHYVAPEVIEPGCYTRTVDYWSIGVMAFEITCGIRPFIPHKDFRCILSNILLKPKKCIAITQLPETQSEERFKFENKIFQQNNSSPIFIDKIEKWLSLALDGNYKTRGSEGGTLKFYTELDAILQTQIVTVFSLTSYQYFYYDMNAFTNLTEFFDKLSMDTSIQVQNMFLTLPTSHPKTSLNNIKCPQDFFVSEWMDTSNPDNPAAMLYVADVTVKQCDFDKQKTKIYNAVSQTIRTLVEKDKSAFDKVPIWLLEEFERHVHYLLSNEQRRLECYVKGLYEYIISIEDEVFRYEATISKIKEDILILIGSVKNFEVTAIEYARLRGQQNSTVWLAKAQQFLNDCQVFKENVLTNIITRYQSVLRHCKQLAKLDIYKTLSKEDIYKVNNFRQFLEEVHRNPMLKNAQRMSKCIESFDAWTLMLSKFPQNYLSDIHADITIQLGLFHIIQNSIKDFGKYMTEFERRLRQETANLLQSLLQADQLSSKMYSMTIDGGLQESATPTVSLMNGVCHQNADFFDSRNLIEESNQLTHSIKSVWGIEIDDGAMNVDNTIPTTIDEI